MECRQFRFRPRFCFRRSLQRARNKTYCGRMAWLGVLARWRLSWLGHRMDTPANWRRYCNRLPAYLLRLEYFGAGYSSKRSVFSSGYGSGNLVPSNITLFEAASRDAANVIAFRHSEGCCLGRKRSNLRRLRPIRISPLSLERSGICLIGHQPRGFS